MFLTFLFLGFLLIQDIVNGNPKLNLAFVANLFNNFPALDLEEIEEEYEPYEENREEKSKICIKNCCRNCVLKATYKTCLSQRSWQVKNR